MIEGCIVIRFLPGGRVQLRDPAGVVFTAGLVVDDTGALRVTR
jgi:hypothetical protein